VSQDRLKDRFVQVRSFLAWLPSTDGGASTSAQASKDLTGSTLLHANLGQLNIAYVPRTEGGAQHGGNDAAHDFLLGDDADLDHSDFLKNTAGGVPIRFDSATNTLRMSTSIVGMPPVYLYRTKTVTAVTSDIHLLRTIPGVRLELDPVSVLEVGQIGHPVEHRSLFRDLVLVESGSHLRFGPDGVTVEQAWRLPDAPPYDWPQFIEAQIDAFTSALAATRIQRSFLSLTAGLDTRTVFSTLAAQQRLLPAATMSGPRLSLDAMIARRLCNAYGVDHMVVTYADQFTQRLPQYMESASLLSGGLASLDQSPEVHMYHHVGQGFGGRLSGNLGNQVGRGGTEGVSVRKAHIGILGDSFKAAKKQPGEEHWLLSKLNQSRRERLDFILRNETVFTSVGNYSVSNHFAIQQSPYGTRQLIETLSHQPNTEAGQPSSSKLRMRLRDLRHRFIGEPEERSFQRTLVHRQGGFAAECPVNWGWKPKGGVSPAGAVMGSATLVGMYARAKGWDGGMLRTPMRITGLPGLHDFRESVTWLREMPDYTKDVLLSTRMRDAGIFDMKVLQPMVENHFSGRGDAYHTLVFALDLALAYRLFCD
jgi:hypothetical protein